MNKIALAVTLLSLMMLAAYVPIASAHNANFPGVGADPYTQNVDVTGFPESFDPAYCYDTTSGAVIINMYETLIYYDEKLTDVPGGGGLGPYQPPVPWDARTGPQRHLNFVPCLSTALPTITYYDPPLKNPKGGLPIYSKWTFPIRTGVQFHFNPAVTLTPRDVEYSIERSLVQSRTGGPTWMWYEMALGAEDFVDCPSLNATHPGYVIDGVIESDASNVYLYLATQYPDAIVKQILSQSWSGIMSEQWAVSKGGLDMSAVAGWDDWEGISAWNNPLPSEIEHARSDPGLPVGDRDGGTGPYMVSYYDVPNNAYSMVAWNDHDNNPATTPRYRDEDGDGDIDIVGNGYWRGWPFNIKWPNAVTGATDVLPGYLNRIIFNRITSWPTRLTRFASPGGQADLTAVPRQYRGSVQYDPGTNSPKVGNEPIRCYYPVTALSGYCVYMTFNVSVNSQHLGGGFDPANPYAWGQDRIPIDFFNDAHVRKAFAASLNYNQWILDAYLGEAEQPSDPIVKGLAYDNVNQPKPVFNMTEAEYQFKVAWPDAGTQENPGHNPALVTDPGKVWDNGFAFEMMWSTGGLAYQLACQDLEGHINALNGGKFHLSDGNADWGSVLLAAMVAHQLPIFFIGWLADFADPHNFVYPFMHSRGTYGASQRYHDPIVDDIIDQGIRTPDIPYSETKTVTSTSAVNLANPVGSTWTGSNYVMDNWMDRGTPTGLSVGDWVRLNDTATYVANWYEVTSMTGTSPTITLGLVIDRQMLYYMLQKLYVEDTPGFMLFTAAGRGWQTCWNRGFLDNKLEPGPYYQTRWKAKTHYGDLDGDGLVNPLDIGVLNAHWTLPPTLPGYNPRADINGGIGGTTGSDYGVWDGIPDGVVNVADKALISAYWDGPPQGLRHP